MPIPNDIERTIDLAHPPERVWTALTTAEGLGSWFGDHADIDLRPGGTAHVHWDEHGEATLQIQVVEPPHRFAYTWSIEGLPDSDPRRTYVEFTLQHTGAGTRLRVIETGFAQLPAELRSAYDGNVDGWRIELDDLTAYLDVAA